MSLAETIRADLVKYADPVMRALQLVQSLSGIGGPGAATALQTIAAVLHTLEQGFADKLDPAAILANLDTLSVGEAANDAAAAAANQAELDKYPPQSTGGA